MIGGKDKPIAVTTAATTVSSLLGPLLVGVISARAPCSRVPSIRLSCPKISRGVRCGEISICSRIVISGINCVRLVRGLVSAVSSRRPNTRGEFLFTVGRGCGSTEHRLFLGRARHPIAPRRGLGVAQVNSSRLVLGISRLVISVGANFRNTPSRLIS